jgi:hypothetical protein
MGLLVDVIHVLNNKGVCSEISRESATHVANGYFYSHFVWPSIFELAFRL